MIPVKKKFQNIPSILTKKARKDAFNQNITSGKYADEKNKYKVASVQKRLHTIYHLKCAYCEKSLLDSPRHIEHYRPKSIYYWLAYSWDNLLLCCGSCNSFKTNNFETTNAAVKYNNEAFVNIHTLGHRYNEIEEPQIINPETEDILDLISFDKTGQIKSTDARVQHTINTACNLNRSDLVKLRNSIVTDFINRMNRHYFYYKRQGDIKKFVPDIKNFIENCTVEKEFYAFRYFVSHHIEVFVEDKGLQKILSTLFLKFRLRRKNK